MGKKFKKEKNFRLSPLKIMVIIMAIIVLCFIVINLLWVFTTFVPCKIMTNKLDIITETDDSVQVGYEKNIDGYTYRLYMPKYMNFDQQIFIEDNSYKSINEFYADEIDDIDSDMTITLIIDINCGLVKFISADFNDQKNDISERIKIDSNINILGSEYNEDGFYTEEEYNSHIETIEDLVNGNKSELQTLLEKAREFSGRKLKVK